MSYGWPGPWGSAAPTAPSDEERLWGTIAHAGCFVAAWFALGILCPIIVLVIKSSSPFVRHHGYESLNFQLNALLWILAAIVLSFVGIGLLLFPIVGLWYLVFVIRASVAANRGKLYRYPLIVRLFR